MTLHDSRGVPIYPGDLLRSPHFRDSRGKLHYLYHVAVSVTDARLDMVPTRHLEASEVAQGGRCPLSPAMARAAQVIHGHGPGDILSYADRPRGVENR